MKNWYIKILLGAVIVSCRARSSEVTEVPRAGIASISCIRNAEQKLGLKQIFCRLAAAAGVGVVVYNLIYTNNIESVVRANSAVAGVAIAVAATACDDILTTKFNDHRDRVIDYNNVSNKKDLDYLDKDKYLHRPYTYPHTRLANWCLGLFGLGRRPESVRLARRLFSGTSSGPQKTDLHDQTLKYFGTKDIHDLLLKEE